MDTAVADDLPTLVVDFLNTLDVEARSDLLDRPAMWSAWARDRGLEPGDAEAARAVRTALRELLGGADVDLPPAQLVVSGRAGDVALAAARPADATQAVLAAVATLAARDLLPRLKLCTADDCRWAFHDRSKNRSRAWCDMAVCGNRAKSRAYRARA